MAVGLQTFLGKIFFIATIWEQELGQLPNTHVCAGVGNVAGDIVTWTCVCMFGHFDQVSLSLVFLLSTTLIMLFYSFGEARLGHHKVSIVAIIRRCVR